MIELEKVIIESKRLLLKPMKLSYAKAIFEEFTAEITTYMYPRAPRKIDETESFLKASEELIRRGNDLPVVIIDKKTNEFLGCAGIHKLTENEPELGIWLKKSAHHQGYGLEAIEALIAWAAEHLPVECLLYPVDKRNIPSRKIPEKLKAIKGKMYNKKNLSNKMLEVIEYHIPLSSTKTS